MNNTVKHLDNGDFEVEHFEAGKTYLDHGDNKITILGFVPNEYYPIVGYNERGIVRTYTKHGKLILGSNEEKDLIKGSI